MPLEHPQRKKTTTERKRDRRERERKLTKLHKLLNPTENQNPLQKTQNKTKTPANNTKDTMMNLLGFRKTQFFLAATSERRVKLPKDRGAQR
jgi:hypothetical protein